MTTLHKSDFVKHNAAYHKLTIYIWIFFFSFVWVSLFSRKWVKGNILGWFSIWFLYFHRMGIMRFSFYFFSLFFVCVLVVYTIFLCWIYEALSFGWVIDARRERDDELQCARIPAQPTQSVPYHPRTARIPVIFNGPQVWICELVRVRGCNASHLQKA